MKVAVARKILILLMLPMVLITMAMICSNGPSPGRGLLLTNVPSLEVVLLRMLSSSTELVQTGLDGNVGTRSLPERKKPFLLPLTTCHQADARDY